MRKLLALVILLAPLCAHAQFAAVNRGPLVGRCNPHTLGIDAVNNDVYECDGSPAQWKLIGSTNGQGGAPFLLRTNSPNCTTLNQLVEYDLSHTDANGVAEVQNALASSKNVIGVVINGAGCSGIATIGTYLSAQCNTDNQSVIGDLVSASASAPGQCDDYGASVNGAVQTVGRVSKVNTGMGTLSQVDFFLGITAPGSSGGSGVVNPCGSSDSVAYYPLANNAVNCDPSFTDNGSGNPTAKSLGLTDNSHAGFYYLTQGTAPTVSATNSIYFYAPTSVTSYAWVLPGTAASGCLQAANVSGIVTISFTGSSCGSGSGSVTSFSSGNLSPLFTTSVSNPTSTPALSFTLSNAGANTVFANLTNSSAAPSYTTTQGTDSKVITAGTVSGTGAPLCTDANGGATTVGCSPGTGGSLNNPSAPTVTPTGTTGGTSYTYGVVGCEDASCTYHSAISGTGSTSTGNATLSSSNYNALTAYGDTLYGYRGYIVCRLTGGSNQGIITSALQAGKTFNDTGLSAGGQNCATLYASNTTLTYPFCLGTSLPGYPSVPGAPCGIDGPPLSPTAYDDEMTQTFGAPGDVNDPYWVWLNQNSATATWTNGTIELQAPSRSASDNLNCLEQAKALPSTPYFYVTSEFLNWPSGVSSHNTITGFGFYESATGKIQTVGVQSSVSNNRWMIESYNNSFTVKTDTYTSDSNFLPYQIPYLGIANDGTHITYYSSPDGIHYQQVYQSTVTNFFTTTPNHIVVCINANAGQASVETDYLREVTSIP